MISVAKALDALFDLVTPLPLEEVALRDANGRVLAQEVTAQRTQPPFDASSMDGYAVKSAEVEKDALFKVVGEAAAGHGWDGVVGAGQAVRIFTGAPVPDGANFVVIQEDVSRRGDLITIMEEQSKSNVRPAGVDFKVGDAIAAPRVLRPADIALLASMNIARVPVARKPVVALISTGDELVMPGEDPKADQIIASNTFGLAAMLESAGVEARVLPIARDNAASLQLAFKLAATADLIVTIGGASVGDHDLVADVAAEQGLDQAFYKVAMRPGKPLMAGQLNGVPMIGLPGNPVSAMVCGTVFLLPVLRKMLGLGAAPCPTRDAVMAEPMGPNGPREHYMRARMTAEGVVPFGSQDSSLLHVLADADVLLVRPPNDPELTAGSPVKVIDI